MSKKEKLKRFNSFDEIPAISDEIDSSKEIKVNNRVNPIADTCGIGASTLIDFLEKNGYKNLKRHSPLPKSSCSLIQREFQNNLDRKYGGKTRLIFNDIGKNDTLPDSEDIISNPDTTYKFKVLYLERNMFDKIKGSAVGYKSLPAIHSFFSDIEAINICKKMSSSFTRNLCDQISKSNTNEKLLKYNLHYIANKALDIFGGNMLTFIYGLRMLNFKNSKVSELKGNFLDEEIPNSVNPDFPIIQFISKKNNVLFKIAFYVKRNRENKGFSPDIRLFSSKKPAEQIGFIDEQGYVITKLEKFKPELLLFYEETKNGNFEISSGVESGECELCERELTHPTSLRIGIGPICAKKMPNIDRTIYKYD